MVFNRSFKAAKNRLKKAILTTLKDEAQLLLVTKKVSKLIEVVNRGWRKVPRREIK